MPIYRIARPVERQFRLTLKDGLPYLESRRRLVDVMHSKSSIQLSDMGPWDVEMYGTQYGVLGDVEDSVLKTTGVCYNNEGGTVVSREAINTDPATKNYLYYRASQERRG